MTPISPNATVNEANKVNLTFSATGQNETINLGECAASLERLRVCGNACEKLFFDSASRDNSLNIAVEPSVGVVELQARTLLNEVASHAAGAIESRGPRILYIDGGMRLRPEFDAERLSTLLGAQGRDGLADQTKNVYPDGSSNSINLTRNLASQPCEAFAAPMLKRRARIETQKKDAVFRCDMPAATADSRDRG